MEFRAIRSPFPSLRDVLGPFGELNDLKRVTSAGRSGSIATRLFDEGWSLLMGGEEAAVVAAHTTRRALAAARLGDLDGPLLVAAGVPAEAARAIEDAAARAVAGPLMAAVPEPPAPRVGSTTGTVGAPSFVAVLAAQPRAGITCPGKPRILLEPPENHAEHCLMVAVYGVLLAPRFEADPVRVFVAALAHHLHNAGMPDSGFTGEMLLGPHLATVMAHATAAALATLPPSLRREVERAREILPDAATPEGRAFHAADVIDRVLQLNHYGRAAALTPEQMLGEMELVHAGPVKGFQDAILEEAGLA